MRTIKTEDEFLEVTASYIYKMIIWDIPVETLKPRAGKAIAVLEQRLSWAREMHAARKKFLDQLKNERDMNKKIRKDAYRDAKEPEY
jgi:RNA binding exosome subunit